MAIDIDGENLIITLPPVVDGVLSVDAGKDLYAEWKTWMKQGNMRYPTAFETSGGEEVTDVLDAGAYFYLQNQNGWRLRPYENNGTYYLTGNLAVGTTTLPAVVPTISTYTATILGIQPITQGVTGLTALNYLEKAIWIDTEAVLAGDGSQRNPFNDLSTAIDYAEAEHIKLLYVYSDIVLDRQLKNFKIVGVGTPTVDTNGQDLTKSEFWHVRVEGTYTGVITVQESVLLPNCYLNGVFEKCGLAGDLFCIDNSQVLLTQCISMIPGLGRPTISMNVTGTTQLSVRKNGGGMTIKDCNQVTDTVTVESSEGSVTFDSSCTDGDMVARGDCKFVDETAGATVTDETVPRLVWSLTEGISVESKTAELWQRQGLDATNPVAINEAGGTTTVTFGSITIDITDNAITRQ